MARTRVEFPRRIAFGCALALPMLSAAHAQMVGGGYNNLAAVQAAQQAQANGTAIVAQPSSVYSNPYSNNGVAQPTVNGNRDPYAMYNRQGVATGQYATPLGASSIMPSGLQTTAPRGGQAYSGAPGYYGGAGEPAAAPTYTVQAQPNGGAYAPAPQAYPQQAYPQQGYPQPIYAPQEPAQAPQANYQPLAYPQYGASSQPQQGYAPQPQYAPPQQAYAPAPQYSAAPRTAPQPNNGVTPVAMAPGNNLIASPYAAMRGTSAGGTAEGGYTLGPGDKVRLTVFGETDLSGEYQLDGNGNIRLPLAGVVHAGGNTAQSLEAVITAALVPNYLRNPRINVEITTYRPIYVVGQVQKPGQYAYVNDMTMLNAIGLAGGFNPQARESTVYVRHAGAAREEQVPTAQPLLILPGDTIRVDSTLFWDAMNMFSPLSGPAYLASAVVH